MFRQTFIKEYFTILNSDGPQPLKLWKSNIKNGYSKRVWDNQLRGFAIEVCSSNISACSIETSVDLGINLPYISIGIKNLGKYFSFKITIRDDFGLRRRFRFSNFETRTRIATFDCSMPLCSSIVEPWNLFRVDLRMLTMRAFDAKYVETVGVTINANCRIRQVYFSRNLLPIEELPKEFSVDPKKRTATSKRRVVKKEFQRELFTAAPPPSIIGDNRGLCEKSYGWDESPVEEVEEEESQKEGPGEEESLTEGLKEEMGHRVELGEESLTEGLGREGSQKFELGEESLTEELGREGSQKFELGEESLTKGLRTEQSKNIGLGEDESLADGIGREEESLIERLEGGGSQNYGLGEEESEIDGFNEVESPKEEVKSLEGQFEEFVEEESLLEECDAQPEESLEDDSLSRESDD